MLLWTKVMSTVLGQPAAESSTTLAPSPLALQLFGGVEWVALIIALVPLGAAIATGVFTLLVALYRAGTSRRMVRQSEDWKLYSEVVPEINDHLNDIKRNFSLWISRSTSPPGKRSAGRKVRRSLIALQRTLIRYDYSFDRKTKKKLDETYDKFNDNYSKPVA